MDYDKVCCADFETTSQSNYEKEGYVRVWLWSLETLNGKSLHGTTLEDFFLHTKKKKNTKGVLS